MPMPIPKIVKPKKTVLKYCKICEKEFWGNPIGKYCDVHRDPSMRVRRRRVKEPVDTHNRIIKEPHLDGSLVTLKCDICPRAYNVVFVSKQVVYPKYCEEHRNEYKRKVFKKLLDKQKVEM